MPRDLDVPLAAQRLGRLVLPGTSYLERDGTYGELEGRLQRLRRAVIASLPGRAAWIAKLGKRFGVAVSPHGPLVFAELSERCYGGIDYTAIGQRASLPSRAPEVDGPLPDALRSAEPRARGLSITYRPLFSAQPSSVPQLQFQRPAPEIELSTEDAARLGLEPGSAVNVRSNGNSVELHAHVNKLLAAGVARVAVEHAQGLGTRGSGDMSRASRACWHVPRRRQAAGGPHRPPGADAGEGPA